MKMLCNQCYKDPRQKDSYGTAGICEAEFLEDGKMWCASHYFELQRKKRDLNE